MYKCSQLPYVETKLLLQKKKIRKLKTRISKLNAQKLKFSPAKIFLSSASNMNNVQGEKYGLCPEEIKKKSFSSGRFKALFSFHRIKFS